MCNPFTHLHLLFHLKHSHSSFSLLPVHVLLILLSSVVYLQVVIRTLIMSIFIVTLFIWWCIYTLNIAMSTWGKLICSTFSAHFLNEVVHMSWVVCLLSQDVGTCCYLLYQWFLLFSFGYFNAFLYYIVTISVFHHLVESSIQVLTCFLLKVTV